MLGKYKAKQDIVGIFDVGGSSSGHGETLRNSSVGGLKWFGKCLLDAYSLNGSRPV